MVLTSQLTFCGSFVSVDQVLWYIFLELICIENWHHFAHNFLKKIFRGLYSVMEAKLYLVVLMSVIHTVVC